MSFETFESYLIYGYIVPLLYIYSKLSLLGREEERIRGFGVGPHVGPRKQCNSGQGQGWVSCSVQIYCDSILFSHDSDD